MACFPPSGRLQQLLAFLRASHGFGRRCGLPPLVRLVFRWLGALVFARARGASRSFSEIWNQNNRWGWKQRKPVENFDIRRISNTVCEKAHCIFFFNYRKKKSLHFFLIILIFNCYH